MPKHDPGVIASLAKELDADARLLERILATPYSYYRRAYRKKSDGTRRRLSVPNDDLKALQRTVLRVFLDGMDKHPADHCRKGRSVVTNAKRHLGQEWIVARDVWRCFPSVKPSMVRRALRELQLAEEFIQPVTSLCTLARQLPQGAPTSPALLSAVLRPLDDALREEADRQGLTYTRYVDDLFVSGNRRFSSYERFLAKAVKDAGLRLSTKKRRRWGPGRRATLAGVVLGTALSPTPDFERAVAQLVNNVVRGALTLDASQIHQLEGRIGWIKALSPAKGGRLFARLRGSV